VKQPTKLSYLAVNTSNSTWITKARRETSFNILYNILCYSFTVKQHTPKMAIVLAWPALKFSKFDDSKS